MIPQIIVGLLFSALVIILSLKKPNIGRIFLGFFFIVMGLGINVPFVLTSPAFVSDYGQTAMLPLYKTLTEIIITPYPVVFGILLIIFEVAMGFCLLSKGKWVKAGLIGTSAFVLLLTPIHFAQIAWAVSIAGNIYLLTKDFDKSFFHIIKMRFSKKA